jgi:hypothetical protein
VNIMILDRDWSISVQLSPRYPRHNLWPFDENFYKKKIHHHYWSQTTGFIFLLNSVFWSQNIYNEITF